MENTSQVSQVSLHQRLTVGSRRGHLQWTNGVAIWCRAAWLQESMYAHARTPKQAEHIPCAV
jgi:hypothetical protein